MAEAPPVTTNPALFADAQLESGEKVWGFTAAITRLGSATDSEVQLTGLSPMHAEISWHKHLPYLRDMGSQTGTRVNGTLLTLPHRLQDGDSIQLGGHELLFGCPRLGRKAGTVQRGTVRRGLEVLNGSDIGLFFGVGAHPILIGSGPQCHLRLREAGVSNQHAVVEAIQGGGATLCDLGSTSGTHLGGSQLTAQQRVGLADGMIFQVGGISIRFGQQQQIAGSPFQVEGKVTVDQGADRGRAFALQERSVVGSAETADVRLQGLFPQHLEIAKQGGTFWARDLTGQSQAYRAGAPIGGEFIELSDGDLLLLGGQVMLRFEEEA